MRRAGVLALAILAGCSASAARAPGRITVAAAASLSAVLPKIVSDFERAYPGSHVTLTFGPSNGLAEQIRSGAPIDVFASASRAIVDRIASDPGVVMRGVFARNRIVLIVPRGDPGDVRAFADLARPGVRLVVAAAGVPAGDAARQAFARAGLTRALRNIVSNEQDVEGVVQKVVAGDADAGIVYATDLTPAVAQHVNSIIIPATAAVEVTYELALVRGGNSILGRVFLGFLLHAAQPTLRAAGFEAP